MKFMHGFDVKYFMTDMIDEKEQAHDYCVDLTVQEIYQLTGGYDLDFSGADQMRAKKAKLEPVKRDEEDKYGWWSLEPGMYLIKYNEKLMMSDTQRAIIQVHSHLMEGGASHPTLILEKSGELTITIMVFHAMKIKQNARVSELRIWQT